jgi:hypothetical protein
MKKPSALSATGGFLERLNVVINKVAQKPVTLFRCTQLVLYPKT